MFEFIPTLLPMPVIQNRIGYTCRVVCCWNIGLQYLSIEVLLDIHINYLTATNPFTKTCSDRLRSSVCLICVVKLYLKYVHSSILFEALVTVTKVTVSLAMVLIFVCMVCLIFYVGSQRSRTRGMAIAVMTMLFIAGG